MRRTEAPADLGAGRERQRIQMPFQADEAGQLAAVRHPERQVAHAGVAVQRVVHPHETFHLLHAHRTGQEFVRARILVQCVQWRGVSIAPSAQQQSLDADHSHISPHAAGEPRCSYRKSR